MKQGNLCTMASASWFANVNNNGNANNNGASNAWAGVRPIPASVKKANAETHRREGKAVLGE